MAAGRAIMILVLIALSAGKAFAMHGLGDPPMLIAQAGEEAAEERPVDKADRSRWGAEIYTGWLGDTRGDGYGYIGGAVDRTLDDTKALTLKLGASYLYYDYDSDGSVISARAPGVTLQAGIKFFRPGAFFAVTGGVGYRNTDLDPDDPTSDVRGSKVGAVFDAHLIKDLSDKVVIDLLGSYSTTGDTFWGRGRFKHLLKRLADGRKIFLGIEGVGEGNSDYTAYRAGGLAELQLIRERCSLLFAAGFRHSSGVGDSAYFGLEYYYRFK